VFPEKCDLKSIFEEVFPKKVFPEEYFLRSIP
jgi:hypothetical protein